MSFTHALATNRYGEADLIVSTSPSNGTHVTLASAMSAAVSGQTIFLRDSVTENVTITPGVNISAWSGGTLNTPTITGTLTMTGAGTSTISGLRLVTNSAAAIAVTGSAASILNVNNCYLNFTNNTGITFSTSNASARIAITDCKGDLGTTGIGLFTHTSAGTLVFFNSNFTNSGSSLTASTCSAGVLNLNYSAFTQAITTSSTSAITWDHSTIDVSALNLTAATLGGSGVHAVRYCRFNSGTASAVSIGSATPSLEYCVIASSNTNAVTGAGTLTYSPLSFEGSSSTVNTSTQVPLQIGPKIYTNGGISFDAGTNTLANYATGTYTPTMVGVVAGVTTYTSQLGFYTRIGNVVYAQAQVTGSAATGTGDINYGALPFTIKNQAGGVPLGELDFVQARTWPAGRTYIAVSGTVNTIVLTATSAGSAVAGANVQMANVAFTDFYSIVYQT